MGGDYVPGIHSTKFDSLRVKGEILCEGKTLNWRRDLSPLFWNFFSKLCFLFPNSITHSDALLLLHLSESKLNTTLWNHYVFRLHHLIKFVVRNVQSVRLIICCYWLLGFIRNLRNCNLQGPIPDLSTIPQLTYV